MVYSEDLTKDNFEDLTIIFGRLFPIHKFFPLKFSNSKESPLINDSGRRYKKNASTLSGAPY